MLGVLQVNEEELCPGDDEDDDDDAVDESSDMFAIQRERSERGQ